MKKADFYINLLLFRTSMLLVGSCATTSFVTGFAVFSIIGNLAFVTGKNVSDVVQSGNLRNVGITFTFHATLWIVSMAKSWHFGLEFD